MSVSMNPVPLVNVEEIKSMNFLGLQINNIFNKRTDKTVQITELAKELLGSKKETSQETKAALLASKYSSFIDEESLKVFAMSLHKLNPLEVGLGCIQKAPGYDPINGFQVPNNWEKNKTVTLNQIYTEQFFAWIVENNQLPFDSILHMLHLLKGFDDLSIQLDDKTWDQFLLNKKKQKQLKQFQFKYEFLIRNKFLQSFPIELKNIKVTRDIQKSIDHQDELTDNFCKWLVSQLLEDAQAPNNVQATNTYQMLINSPEGLPKSNFSKKVLAYKLKKTLPLLQDTLDCLMECFEKDKEQLEKNKAQLKEFEESQVEIKKVLEICREKREQISSQKSQSAKDRRKASSQEGKFNIQDVIKDMMEQYNELNRQGVDPIERDAQVNQRLHKTLKEKMTTLKHVQAAEACFVEQNRIFAEKKIDIQKPPMHLYLLKEQLSCVRFLVSHMNADIAREQVRWKGEGLNLSINQLDKTLEKEFAAECKISSFKTPKRPQKPLNLSNEEEPISSKEEEASVALLEKPLASSSTHAPEPCIDDEQEKIQSYLKNKAENKQLNGVLSQSVEIILRKMQPYLYQKQGKEAYDHALLGAAALEQMAQAIHENRTDHVVVGFRSSLIHCHFAVEQILKQKIFQKTGKIEDSHNLTFLANTLKEDREFLKEIRVHLWFHYPEDYRLYFAYNNATPKAFSLLETLFQPGITQENVQEAMEFAFEKYYQTLKFMAELSGSPVQNAVELFKSNAAELQKYLNPVGKKLKKPSVNTSSLLPKMDRVLEKLTSLDQFIHMKDFEDGGLLAIFDSIKSYLQLMKSSLETPQAATTHSLQKFIQVETLFNMERLFKNLFRAVGFLHLGKDNRIHNLSRFYSVIQEFYKEPLSEEDGSLLKNINLSIAHHYLHEKSQAYSIKSTYSRFLDKARSLSSLDEGFSINKGSALDLQKEMEEDGHIMQTMHKSLDLFIKLLHPVIDEIERINNNIEEGLSGLQIR